MDKKQTGNIKPEHQFDPFPKDGLTKQFEPFIRKEVEKYLPGVTSMCLDQTCWARLSG